MLTTILVLLIVLWLLGMVSSYTLGGFIHILLIIAITMLAIGEVFVVRHDSGSHEGPTTLTGASTASFRRVSRFGGTTGSVGSACR
mgnify:CR=1 FL=1